MNSVDLPQGFACLRPMAVRRLPRVTSPAGVASLVFVVGLLVGLLANTAYRDFKKQSQLAGLRSARGAAALSKLDMIKISAWERFHVASDIVMVGDSHTDLVDWRSIFPEKSISNRGVSGDTTRAVLERLDTIAPVAAGVAVVMLGTNDIAKGLDLAETERNYDAIIDTLRSRGSRVIVTSTPFMASRRRSGKIASLNAHLEARCAGGRCTFIDLNMKISTDGVLRSDRTIDGCHLNGDGYADWANLLAPHL